MALKGLMTGKASSREADELIAAANSARDDARWEEAAGHYRAALDRVPANAPIWVQLGNMAKESSDFSAAKAAYGRALELAPDHADTHLQMGHLLKLMNRQADAAESYRTALRLDPGNHHAYAELAALGLGAVADRISAGAGNAADQAHRYVFDVSDLVFYIGHHSHLTGIQRVQCAIILAIVREGLLDEGRLLFASFDRVLGQFRTIDSSRFLALLDDLFLPDDERICPFDREMAKAGQLFTGKPLRSAIARGKATIVLLGAAWVIPDYALQIARFKQEMGCRFVMIFHDFIPIYARETCHQGTAEVFGNFIAEIIGLVDQALCVSRNTASDLERFCRDHDHVLPPIAVTRLGAGFGQQPGSAASPSRATTAPPLVAERFVLFVSTIEGRKNHEYALRIWRKLLADGVDVPKLVCVGRLGWRSEGFCQSLIATDYLGGKVEILQDVSDSELTRLYRDSLFTIYPSLYEGWGLPVSESLERGKVCVLSNSSSLPEVAGDLGVYIPLDDLDAAAGTVRHLIEDARMRSSLEARIAKEYRPDSWTEVAGRVIAACEAVAAQPARPCHTCIEPGREYALRSPVVRVGDAMGQDMMDAITASRRGVLLGRLLTDHDIIAALRCRSGDWHLPESWGCWTTGLAAALEFTLDPDALSGSESVLIYLALSSISGRPEAELRIGLGRHGKKQATRRLSQHMETIMVDFRTADILSGPRQANGTVLVRLDLSMVLETAAITPPPIADDTRSIGFGVRSLLIVPQSDLATRLAVVEQLAL